MHPKVKMNDTYFMYQETVIKEDETFAVKDLLLPFEFQFHVMPVFEKFDSFDKYSFNRIRIRMKRKMVSLAIYRSKDMISHILSK